VLNKILFLFYIPSNLQRAINHFSLDKDDKDDVFIASVLQYIEEHPAEKVRIVSNDFGVQLKCKAQNLEVIIPAEEYLLIEEDNSEKEIRKLTSELLRVKNLQPKLKLVFENGEAYKQFDMREPWKECEDEINETLERIKKEHPFLQPDLDDTSSIFSGFDLYKKTPERVANFNEALKQYYSDYEVYLRKNKVFSYKEKLTVILTIKLQNHGNAPGEDIDVYLHFPDGFKLGEKDDYYAKDREPSPPELSSYSMAPIDFSKIIPSLYMPILPQINPGGFSIKKTNSYEVRDHFRSIKHNHLGSINALYVMFDRFEDAKSFEITYKITAANMIEMEEGKLTVIINKIEDDNEE
jgi:hypothetical protein